MEDKQTDDFGREINVGDFVYFGKGTWHNSGMVVIRGIEKSFHTIQFNEIGHNDGNKWVNDGYRSYEGHINYGARSVLKMEIDWIATFPDAYLVEIMFRERHKVMTGEYNKKKKKNNELGN